MKLSIIIPCYNEADNIPLLLESYSVAITRDDIEVVLVNNGSTDCTTNVLEKMLVKYKNFLSVVNVPINEGYGHGILSGLKSAKGTFIGWSHGDMQTPPKDVIRALSLIEDNGNESNLYIKGKRVDRPLIDQFFTSGMSLFETVYLGIPLSDINAQPNVFHRSFFNTWKNPPKDFALDLYVLYLAKKQNLKIIRFTVPFLKRAHGSSKWNTGIFSKWKFIKRTLQFSLILKKEHLL
jgi:glycosyltransferase involved in cell wall biosynthesis